MKHEAILRLTSSLALPLFSIPSKNRLYISAKNEVLRILMPGALFQREKLPGYRPGLTHVQPFVTNKTSGKSRGLTSLDFAQLGPVGPSSPPYLHSVYRVQSCSISTCDNFEIPSTRSVFGCHNTKDPNVPLCSSSAVVLRKIIHHNMSRWSILPFTLAEIVFVPDYHPPPKTDLV